MRTLKPTLTIPLPVTLPPPRHARRPFNQYVEVNSGVRSATYEKYWDISTTRNRTGPEDGFNLILQFGLGSIAREALGNPTRSQIGRNTSAFNSGGSSIFAVVSEWWKSGS
ncbi:hypothetical protein GWI33_013667 [Rhynchophorus ferrugineus]|uniref:Uncharacterized protein n=1 Tax=Rhynchophorus ferrugineus TaxID=354439 RepID=A0A834I8Q4_RHYFE|nr:hypothetical protein GWI33_013667 [Rhynchophorus ferrugineus]